MATIWNENDTPSRHLLLHRYCRMRGITGVLGEQWTKWISVRQKDIRREEQTMFGAYSDRTWATVRGIEVVMVQSRPGRSLIQKQLTGNLHVQGCAAPTQLQRSSWMDPMVRMHKRMEWTENSINTCSCL